MSAIFCTARNCRIRPRGKSHTAVSTLLQRTTNAVVLALTDEKPLQSWHCIAFRHCKLHLHSHPDVYRHFCGRTLGSGICLRCPNLFGFQSFLLFRYLASALRLIPLHRHCTITASHTKAISWAAISIVPRRSSNCATDTTQSSRFSLTYYIALLRRPELKFMHRTTRQPQVSSFWATLPVVVHDTALPGGRRPQNPRSPARSLAAA